MAVHKLGQPGERQAALGVIEGLLGSRTYQVMENPCLRICAIRPRIAPWAGTRRATR